MPMLTRIGEFPVEFTCASGELVWGQLNTVLEGHAAGAVDTPAGPRERLTGGTILQHNFAYRVRARRGRWRVREIEVGGSTAVHICHHESVDAAGLVRRAAAVGISNCQQHTDKRVVYVNRYDWSWHHRPGAELISERLRADVNGANAPPPVDDEALSVLIGGRFLLLDKDGVEPLLNALRGGGERLEQLDYRLGGDDGDGGQMPFGVQVSCEETEYELGWMIFDDKEDELIGFVYDGQYCVLGRDEELPLVIEGETI